MMFFFFRAIATLFYHHVRSKPFAYKKFVQTGYFRSFKDGRTSYNVSCANSCEIRGILSVFWVCEISLDDFEKSLEIFWLF